MQSQFITDDDVTNDGCVEVGKTRITLNNLPWWGWADRRVWDVHSWWWNLALPVVVVVTIAGAVT